VTIETQSIISYPYRRLHLVALTILFLTSLLIVCKAPTYDLWLLAVFASEYSIVFIALAVLLLLTQFLIVSNVLLGTVIGLLAIVLFLSPILRAYLIGQHLPNDLDNAFRSKKKPLLANRSSFSFSKLLQAVPKVPFRTLVYATHDDAKLTLDYYASNVSGKRPCVLVIHGGSWTHGNSKQLAELNSHLARRGYHCAAMNYRLAPRWKCPAPIEDATAALHYLREHANELNIDPENFVLLGRSAGGQIALLTAYTLQHSGIKGVIDFYGPADMIWGYKVPTNPLVIKSQEVLVRYVGGEYPQIPEKYRASSPIEFVNQRTVPTLILHGCTDALVFTSHSARLVEQLKKHNVLHYFLELPWATHGFDYHLNGPGGQLSTYAIEYFLRVVTDS
jgi:acetyl esterase/lipase